MVEVKRVLLAGGGTAGHVNPLLATARALVKRGHQVVVLGTKEGLESELIPAAGFDLITIPKVPIPRRPSTDLLRVPTRLNKAVGIARNSLSGVDVVVGYGGYVSAPAYLAARKEHLPVVIHEQNARSGWANRLGARKAKAVALTFPNTNLAAKRGITKQVGMPLREEIADLVKERLTEEGRREARSRSARIFGLDPDLPTLLVTGGSLGAVSLNRALQDCAGRFPQGLQILHLTGRGKDQEVLDHLKSSDQSRWVVRDYLREMHLALAAADLVLCRSGAGTVAENGALGLPAVYVPLPFGNGEQALNAHSQVEAKGALLVPDGDLNAKTFEQIVFPCWPIQRNFLTWERDLAKFLGETAVPLWWT